MRGRPSIIIERLNETYNISESYRLRILVAGEYVTANFSLGDIHRAAGITMEIRRAVNTCLASLFRQDSVRQRVIDQVMEIVERNGDLDNTAEVLAFEERERMSRGVTSPPPNAALDPMVVSTHALELLRGMRDFASEELIPRPIEMSLPAVQMTASRLSADMSAMANDAIRNVREFMGRSGLSLFQQEYTWGVDFADPHEDRTAIQRARREDPARRAWLLLYKTIGKQLSRQFKKHKYFEVQGKRGIYRFHRDKQGGVTFIETRQYGDRQVAVEFDLCIQSKAADLPEGDVILSRYLSWKADEEAFLQTANFRKVRINDEANTRNPRAGLFAFPWLRGGIVS